MKKGIISALLVSLASLGICTNANAMENGKKTVTGISNKINKEKNVEPTWNGRPISQELRLVHLPACYGGDMPAWRQYWELMVEENPQDYNLQDGIDSLNNKKSYVFLVDSNDTVLGYCTYEPLITKDNFTIDEWLKVIPENQVYNTMCCDLTCVNKKLKGYGIGLAMLRKAIELENPTKTWVLYDASSASWAMNYHVYSKLGFERALISNNGVLRPYEEYDKAGHYIRQHMHKTGHMIRYSGTQSTRLKKAGREGIDDIFHFLDRQNTLSEKSIKRCDSLAYETLQDELTQKKYEEKFNQKKKYEEQHPQYEERRQMS